MHHLAYAAGKVGVDHAVQRDRGDGILAGHRLAARLEVDIKRQALEFLVKSSSAIATFTDHCRNSASDDDLATGQGQRLYPGCGVYGSSSAAAQNAAPMAGRPRPVA